MALSAEAMGAQLRAVAHGARAAAEGSRRMDRMLEAFEKTADSILMEVRNELRDIFAQVLESPDRRSMDAARLELVFDKLYLEKAKRNMQEEFMVICNETSLLDKFAVLEALERGEPAEPTWPKKNSSLGDRVTTGTRRENPRETVRKAVLQAKRDRLAKLKERLELVSKATEADRQEAARCDQELATLRQAVYDQFIPYKQVKEMCRITPTSATTRLAQAPPPQSQPQVRATTLRQALG
jgi:hypothetical protein